MNTWFKFVGLREQVTRLILLNWRLGRIFSHTELLTYGILYPMMLNMQKIQFKQVYDKNH